MFLYENKYETIRRMIFDKLPYSARRHVFRVMRPATYKRLMNLRQDGGWHEHADLSVFLKRRALFVHVPKAAGRSIRKALFAGRTASHMTMHYYMLAFSRNEFESLFKFTFVRNPWDRVYSAYRFLMAGGVHAGDARYAESYLSGYRDFEDFVLRGLGRAELENVVHFLPATHFIEMRPGQMHLDFIGYVETFDEDFEYIAKRMGVKPERPVWENRTRGKKVNYRDAYSDAMIDKVSAVYHRDIAVLGYSFDDFVPHARNQK